MTESERHVTVEKYGEHGKFPVGRPGPLRALKPRLGAEIGCHRGKNAATLLARMPNLKLYMVDPWRLDCELGGRSEFMAQALAETEFAALRRVIVRKPSPDAAVDVPNDLDFAFIDGDHSYEACLADLEAWWPKVRSGGMLFGHDIDHPNPEYAHWGVRRAAEEFFDSIMTDAMRDGSEPDFSVQVFPWPEMVFAVRKP